MEDPVWVPRVAVIAAHFEQLREHGGLQGLRDANGLDSALARPQHTQAYEPGCDVADLAAAYLYGIARGQHFADGNKRAALATTLMFLEINGFELTDDVTDEVIIGLVLSVADGSTAKAECARWIRERLIAR